jgi:acyl carrier protein
MSDEIFNKLAERCAYLWGVDASAITPDTTFAEHNTKSTQISQMTTYLEDELDCEVPYMQFKRCKTVGEAAAFVADLLDE